MMRNILSLFLFLFVGFSVYAQDPCGTQDYLDYLETQDPGIKEAMNLTFYAALDESQVKNKVGNDTVFKVKVVIHNVYFDDSQLVADSNILSQLDVLNECFRRQNADTVNTREIFLPVAGDSKIEFELATEDPFGNPTDGIVRKKTIRPTFGSIPANLLATDLVKNDAVGSGAWDTEKYLNIWVCDLSAQGFQSLLGYAYPPTGAANWNGTASFATADRQGVVVHYNVVGRNNEDRFSTGNRTLVHEVGHYLGLRHIWGDGPCGTDDFMRDTPRARRASNGCNKGVNTCTEFPGEEQQPDMLENYMDYSNEECQNMFTNDQIAQMRANLRLFRSGIYEEQIIIPEPEISFDDVNLYPNPAKDIVKLHIPDADENVQYRLEITTLLGQRILELDLSSIENQEITGLRVLQGVFIYILLADKSPITTGRLFLEK